MAEQGHLETDRLALAAKLAQSMYGRLVALVITDIRNLPDNCRQSGDDSKLKNVWEEFKDQLQNEQYAVFAAYEHTIQSLCFQQVAELDPDRQRMLWLWSEGYLQLWVDEDEVRLADLDVSHVEEELYRRVCKVAANEPLRHEVEDEIYSLWPGDWPGQRFVDLDNVGDPGDWILTSLGEPPSMILQNLPQYEENLSKSLAEDYLNEIEEQGVEMPWAAGDDPDDPVWIAECRANIEKEFVAFLRKWRERAADELEKLNPRTEGEAVAEQTIQSQDLGITAHMGT